MFMRAFVATVVLATGPALAKTCDSLKAEVDTKIKANGVKSYTLDIVVPADVKDQKVVGSCDGGKKRLVYSRSQGDAKPAAEPAPAKPVLAPDSSSTKGSAAPKK